MSARVRLLAALTTLSCTQLALAIACTSSNDTGAPPETQAVLKDAKPAKTSDQEVRPVSLPDLSRSPRQVQEQVRERFAVVEQAIEGKAPAEELARAYGEVGVILMAAEYPAVAETSLRNAHVLAPTDARWPYYLGQFFAAQGDRAKASEFFERALHLRPADFPTLVRLGGTYLDEGRSEDSERMFTKALAVQPQSAAALSGLGRAVLARGNATRAAEYLERALTIEPDATSLHYPLAMAYRSLGELQKADAHLRLRGRGEPAVPDPLMQEQAGLLESALAYQNRGLEALQAADFSAAAAHFRRALELEPKNPALGHMLATSMHQRGEVEAAVRQFEEVLRWSPTYARAHFSLGVIFESQGRDEEAAARFAAAVKYEPDNVEARFGLAHCLQLLGRLEQALPHYRHVVKVDPRRADAWIEAANVLVGLEQYREAHDWLAAAAKIHPEHPDIVSRQKSIEALLPGRRAAKEP
jgi:tetratricopeptide (TPR) repeat protein